MTQHGTYEMIDGRPAIRFERQIGHPVEKVWQAISEPAGLHHWFPSEVEIEPVVGGAMHFSYSPDFEQDGEVREIEAPVRLAFRWGEDELRFTLIADGDSTVLTMLHILHEEGPDAAAKVAAGWHTSLDHLGAHLDGQHAGRPSGGPTPQWRAHYEDYVARGVPDGAEIPGAA